MNRKSLLFTSLLAVSSIVGMQESVAQIGNGGFPMSFNAAMTELRPTVLSDENFTSLLNGTQKPTTAMYEVGWGIPFKEDIMGIGAWHQLADGSKVYKATLQVDGAKALALYYKDFYLPKGVRLYLYNDNHKQVLGAYDHTTSPESRVFSNEPIIGDRVHWELNIDPGVDINNISIDLDYVGAYYRGLDLEEQLYGTYAGDVPLDEEPVGSSARCHVNAICPQGDPMDKARKSTLRIVISNGPGSPMGFCSGTLINNTGNEANGTCRPLFLTASHCDGDNGMNDAHFQHWQFRFNFQMDACTNGNPPTHATSPTLTSGAKFKARSNYPSFPTSGENPSLVQDFLLLELNGTLPTGYHLIGWNRATNLASDPAYLLFYGFHHPAGDVKKMSRGADVQANGTFNQNTVNGTHWKINYTLGGTSPGSSGSGLFDSYGRIVGPLSGGAQGNCPTDGRRFGADALYSKISYGWENQFDQDEFPNIAGPTTRLKDHLDPLNLGLTWLPTAEADQCSDFTSVKVTRLKDNDVHIYPVPATEGSVTIQVNLNETADFDAQILDISGRVLQQFSFNTRGGNIKTVDVNELPAGIYFLKLNSALGAGQYKFVIAK